MQRLFSPKLEATAIRSITSSDDRVAGWLFSHLTSDHFSFEPSQEFFRRVLFLTNKKGTIPRWEDLLEDLSISEDARDELDRQPSGVIAGRREARLVAERLDEYRRARIFFGIGKTISRSMRDDRLDLEALTERVGDQLARTRGTGRIEDGSAHFGGEKLDMRALRELLNGAASDFIPTGLRAFDSQSQGVPRGSAWVIAGPTGGGKSALAVNVAINQSRMGAKVSLTSQEISRLAVDRRIAAIVTGIPLSQINRIHEADRATRRLIAEAMRDFHAQIRRNGGRLSIFAPDEDLSIEELLTFLRSRGYDNNIVDYMGLLKGMDGEDQWRKLGAGARYAKRYTAGDNSIATLLAQLSEEGELRYSRAVQEHASLMWKWARPDESGIMTIKQPKARETRSFDFPIHIDFATMRVTDVDLSQVAGRVATSGRRDARSPPTQRGRGAPPSGGKPSPEKGDFTI